MGKTKLTGILMHLEPHRAEALNRLAEKQNKKNGMKRSELIREAIDDLLVKYGVPIRGRREP